MKRLAFFICLAGLPIRGQTVDLSLPPVSPAPRFYKAPLVSDTVLANGLTVTFAEDPRIPLITARLVFLAGTKRDPKDLPGLAAGVAALLMEGTTQRTRQEIAEELDSLGAHLNVMADADSLTISASSLDGNAAGLLDLLADVSRNAVFPSDELDLYKQNLKRTMPAQRSQPGLAAADEFRKLIFGDVPYAHAVPTLEAMDKLDRKALEDFRDSLLVPNNAYLILVGKLPSAELSKIVAHAFGSWQRKAVPAYAAPKPPAPRRQLVLMDRPGSVQAEIRLGGIAATYSDPAFFAETLAAVIAGAGSRSRLSADILEKRGYAAQVETEITALADTGTFATITQVRNDVAADALQAILEDLERMAKEPVERQELADAKSYTNGVFLRSMEQQSGLADRLAQIKIMNLPKNYLDTYATRVNSVDADQIESAVKKYVAPDAGVIVVVGDASKLQKSLEKIGPFQIIPPEEVKTSQ